MQIEFLIPGRRNGRALSPHLIHTGIPGTEEAYINISKHLAALGHGVTVYADCRDEAGDHDGVIWCDLAMIDRRPPADVTITSTLDALVAAPPVPNARVYLWLHVHLDIKTVIKAADRWHKLMPLSAYSRKNYGMIPDDRVFLTRNGIDATHFHAQPVERVPNRIVYGSDYDRGLPILLRRWPQIRALVPDATLHVFYGWEMFEWKLEHLRQTNPSLLPSWLSLRKMVEDELTQDGVTHLGRIGHDRVAEEFLAADVWAYPCTFPETSCITAMKAQAAGAIPVVFPTAALRETVRFGVRTLFDPLERSDLALQLGDAWYQALIGTLGDRAGRERIRGPMMSEAQVFFDWASVASEWSVEFTGSAG